MGVLKLGKLSWRTILEEYPGIQMHLYNRFWKHKPKRDTWIFKEAEYQGWEFKYCLTDIQKVSTNNIHFSSACS